MSLDEVRLLNPPLTTHHLLPNEEVVEGVIDRNHIRFHPGNAGPWWPRPQPVDQTGHGLVFALGPYLHPPISQIADPADQPQAAGG